MRFSQRLGYTPVKDALQLESIDDDLRNSLWSALQIFYRDTASSGLFVHAPKYSRDGSLISLWKSLWLSYFKRPIDTIEDYSGDICAELRKYFFSCEWYEVYDFIEFVALYYPVESRNINFRKEANDLLEREVAGYRFIDGAIAEITNPVEIDAIESAATSKDKPVSEHLDRALQLMSDRRNPDYRNSIKESISAVEAQVNISLGEDKGTLGALLKQVTQKSPLHPALQEAFSKLYGYTSDAAGIRHALIDESKATFEEAKFMLVACSAFISYVRGVLKD